MKVVLSYNWLMLLMLNNGPCPFCTFLPQLFLLKPHLSVQDKQEKMFLLDNTVHTFAREENMFFK